MKRTLNVVLAVIVAISSIVGNSAVVKAETEKEKTVIALDPGHDERHGGASAGGLNEQDLTLKIAYYCKEELEKHDEIEVYMTRTDAACPYPDTTKSARCIEQRVIAAANAGASMYVSLHLNAEEWGTSACGVEVIYPNDSWNAGLGSTGMRLAQYIQGELTALGLYDRGIYYRNSTIGETYPDGSVSDYYTAQIAGKENGIASVIVENAFITNATDRANFLQTEEGLKKLGVANANAILKTLGNHVGWEYWDNHWYYYVNNVAQTGWQAINGYWYYFNEVGQMQTDWEYVDGFWYYMNSDGQMQTGWLQQQEGWYYLNPSGAMQIGWKVINGTKYLFDNNGLMVDGAQAFIIDVSKWQGTIDWDKVVAAGVDGAIVRCGHGDETTEPDGQWRDPKFEENIAALNRLGIPYGIYYYNTATTVEQARIQARNAVEMIKQTNAQPTMPVFADIEQDAGNCDLVSIAKIYMEEFVANGYKAGIYANDNYWKNYLNDLSLNVYYKWVAAYGINNGNPASGFIPVNGFENYMMWQYTSQSVLDGITANTVDCNVLFEWHNKPNGWLKNNGAWYYYENGRLAHDWRFINGQWYYFANGGQMQTGWQAIRGNWYYMDNNGVMQTGWKLLGDSWYYMAGSGAMQTGWLYLNGTWYYMTQGGAMQTGWECVNGIWYYMDKNGAMVTGWRYLENTWYYMAGSGAMQTGWVCLNGTWYYMDQSGAMRTGWEFVNGIWYYMDRSGAMVTGWKYLEGTWYYMDGSGAMLTGQHTIGGKTYLFSNSGAWIG